MSTYSRLSFTNEEEKELIGFIKNHPGLWDATAAEYGDAKLRSRCWQTISRRLNKTEEDCRRKWRFIRDYYLHKRKNTSEIVSKASKYLDVGFLQKVIVRRMKISHKHDYKRSFSYYQNEECAENVEGVTIESSEEYLECSDLDSVDLNETNITLLKEETDEEQVLESELLKTKDLICHNTAKNVIKNYKPSGYCVYNNEDGDAIEVDPDAILAEIESHSPQDKVIDLFFESMAATVKTFPPQLMARAKLKVFNAINELEMELHQPINDNDKLHGN